MWIFQNYWKLNFIMFLRILAENYQYFFFFMLLVIVFFCFFSTQNIVRAEFKLRNITKTNYPSTYLIHHTEFNNKIWLHICECYDCHIHVIMIKESAVNRKHYRKWEEKEEQEEEWKPIQNEKDTSHDNSQVFCVPKMCRPYKINAFNLS